MGKGKRANNKKAGPAKLSPAVRSDVTLLVDKLIKKCAKVPGQSSFSAKQECEDFEQIYEIVEQIRELEKGITLPTYDRAEQMKEFFTWAKAKEIKCNKVTAAPCGDAGYGLVCQADLVEGEVVLEVPVSAMITEHCAVDTYLGPLIARDPLLQEMGNVRLALHVLVEYLNPASEWRPYVRSLPSTFHTPVHLTPSQIQRIKHSPVLESVVKQYRNIGRQYAYFYRIIRSLPEARDWPLNDFFTYDAYRWAVCCVCTRINSIPSSTGSPRPTQLALVPCWDLVNHSPGKMSTDFNDSEKKLVCYANGGFSAGQQFTIHYGSRGNADLFLHSGFVDANNSNDSVNLRLGISKSDPLSESKESVLSAMGLAGVREFAVLAAAGDTSPLSDNLWAFSVVFTAGEEFISQLQASSDPSAMVKSINTDPAHATLRKTAASFLFNRIALLLRAYDNKLPDAPSSPLDDLISSLLECEALLLQQAQRFLQPLT